MRGFAVMWVAAMDGTHIYRKAPFEDAEAYINCKHPQSVLLQGTIDYSGWFVDVAVRNLGRDHNAHLMQCWNIFDAIDAGMWVLGHHTHTIEGFQIPPLIIADAVYPI